MDVVQRSRCSLHTLSLPKDVTGSQASQASRKRQKSSISGLYHIRILTAVARVRFGMCGGWVVRGFSFLKEKIQLWWVKRILKKLGKRKSSLPEHCALLVGINFALPQATFTAFSICNTHTDLLGILFFSISLRLGWIPAPCSFWVSPVVSCMRGSQLAVFLLCLHS